MYSLVIINKFSNCYYWHDGDDYSSVTMLKTIHSTTTTTNSSNTNSSNNDSTA